MKRAIVTGLMIIATVSFFGCSATKPDSNLQLIKAAEKGETRKVEKLILAGADINAMNREGWTPYLAASTNGHLETMELLKKAGARTDVPLDDLIVH